MVVIKGAGDLATGCAWRLLKSGFDVVMTELPQPLVVRRAVAFAEAVYAGSIRVEGVEAVLAKNKERALQLLKTGRIPVLVDPEALVVSQLKPVAVVDAVMAKRNTGTKINDAPLVIGLGPGFAAGVDVHAVVETKRGHNLGRVLYQGEAAPDTGVPGDVMGFTAERLLRAPVDGVVQPLRNIGDPVKKGETTVFVGSTPLQAGISGVIRGMIKAGVWAPSGMKIGDIDPRGIKEYCYSISDKALAVGGGVLEAVCSYIFDKSSKGFNSCENYGSLRSVR
ncbi:MAG: selenium-dependent molybdenum cofactor biosynthesis protein YqeB [Desulfotomaculaceae bacterium]|nr:selenium-dependent molybdenum cofactor biosynthesis protein YqeB [Desulfotomaculaceae bacterium]MDD4767944.1 selenium-dependent molybdenum cofactor biosynthesis protein YqeB [Desulfotomaculaceae bacterium]